MVKYLIKTFFTVFLATTLAVISLFCVWSANVCRLSALSGERVFYLHSASSQGLRKTGIALADFTKVRGESVCFALEDCAKTQADALQIAQEIAAEFGAEILKTETCSGVYSYYAHTPRWADGILVGGQIINLHVAVSGGRCVVGTPIIFDGF